MIKYDLLLRSKITAFLIANIFWDWVVLEDISSILMLGFAKKNDADFGLLRT